jgi:hypothetical protein
MSLIGGICEGFLDGLEDVKPRDRSQVSTLPSEAFLDYTDI